MLLKKTRVYIGIETKVREFESKLLLACAAAEAGFDVVLGQQKLFLRRLGEMPRGILLNKSISPSKAGKYAHYKKLGFSLVAYDEEGFVPYNADEYQKRRVSLEALNQLDCFFAWGQWQTGVILDKAPQAAGKVIPVGHPRLDLTRKELRGFYDDDVKRLRDQYGRFILINTSFSLYNHFRGKKAKVELLGKAGKIADENQREFYVRLAEFKKQLFYAFADMVVAMHERFPQTMIILRSHPSEDHDYWRQTLPDSENIQVVHEGTVLPWLMAAEVMIHNSCTTGVEGYLLERPVIAYRPVQSEELEIHLPHQLSEQECTLEGVLERVERYLTHGEDARPAGDGEKRKIAARYVTGMEGPFSCDLTVKSLGNITLRRQTLEERWYQAYMKGKRVGKSLLKSLLQRKTSHKADNDIVAEYRRQKFPGISADEMQRSVAKFRRLTGRFVSVEVIQLEKNLFRLVRGD
jgi:surface carbohydrate biosynthesis protein